MMEKKPFEKKTILICAPTPPPYGGIANWYTLLYEESIKNEYEVINIDTSPKKEIKQRTLIYRVVVQGIMMLILARRLKKEIRRKRDEILVAHIATSGSLALFRDILFLAILNKNNIKAVIHIHYGRVPEIIKKNNIEFRLLVRAIILADNVIAIDRNTLKALENIGFKSKTFYVPNPVKTMNKIDITCNNEVIFLGNVFKEKGIEELLLAWSKLSFKYENWKLKLIGHCEDEYRKYLEDNFSMRNVEFVGFIKHDEALKQLSEAALLVLPSYTEGFPNVVVEAMMCEKAVIATAVGAIEDILSGNCGIVIRPQDITSLTNSIEYLIMNESDRKKMGVLGKRKVLEHYTVEKIFSRYEEIWHIS